MAVLRDAYHEIGPRLVVCFQLDKHLDLIAGGGNLSQVVFNLIAWAERTGRDRGADRQGAGHQPGERPAGLFWPVTVTRFSRT